ncbi:MAG TPA: ABC transporter permease, partial [Candidatus Solibacter sp.]|nr:ABC transporter permease [Candidatus Solibacter sp.]
MSLWKEWSSELSNRLRGRASGFDAELDQEIRFHLEARSAELEGAGVPPGEARLQARREFGPIAIAGEESRDAWHFRWVQDFFSDLHHAVRTFARSPIFTLTAVISLGLGIGATSAIFTSVDAVLWRPIPVAKPDELVHFAITRGKLEPETDLPAPFARQLSASGVFDSVLMTSGDGLSFIYDGRAERIIGEFVSPNYFEALGVRPYLGENFSATVRAGDWAAEAVLTYSFWQRRFGGDHGVIGRTFRLNDHPFTIVGVSQPGFFGVVRGVDYELRIPLLPEGRDLPKVAQISGRPDRWIDAIGRLKPGVTMAQTQSAADAQLQSFLRTTNLKKFQTAHLEHMQLSPAARGYDEYTSRFHTPLYVLLVLVGIVLLIACSNVANMLLARATAGARELAVRVSIGAGRFRLIRQMLAESLLLSALGGLIGLAIANWAAEVLFSFLPQGHISFVINLHPDRRALLFTFAVSLATGLIFGLLPALQATRGDIASTLKA